MPADPAVAELVNICSFNLLVLIEVRNRIVDSGLAFLGQFAILTM